MTCLAITDHLVDRLKVAPCPDRFTAGTRSVWNRSNRAQEPAHSDEVVRHHAQGEHPTDQGQPLQLDLPDSRRCFEPSKGMLDRVSPELTDAVPSVAGRPLVDSTGPPRIDVLSHVRSDALCTTPLGVVMELETLREDARRPPGPRPDNSSRGQ